MSAHGSPDLDLSGAQDLRVAIVAGLWHERVMDGLLGGARRALADAGYLVIAPRHADSGWTILDFAAQGLGK